MDQLTDVTNSFCTTIEALFLHGLKSSFFRQTFDVIIAGEQIDRLPEPNFWSPLLIISHKETINQVFLVLFIYIQSQIT